jgi:chromate reductase, NAD(P)H dehydrogenase (quinone)
VISILAISGSLRAGSSNGSIVAAAEHLAPEGASVFVFDGLADLPPFNPDLELHAPPAVVTAWRETLQTSDAVFISSPEYAHGVPGVLKNALDWVVGSGEFMHKPVALVNGSAVSTFVTAQLTETLSVMMADVVIATSLPLNGRPSSASDILADPTATAALRAALQSLADTAQARVAADEPRRLIPRA